MGAPYISCSSIGSTSSSSSPESSESDDAEGENGSGRCADVGTMLANSPLGILDGDCTLFCRRRLGKSEALRMVGLALSISDMIIIVDEFCGCECRDLLRCLGYRTKYQMNSVRLEDVIQE